MTKIKEKRINSITDGSMIRAFVLFILPMIGSGILMQSYVIADGLILGNAINQEALGSVSSVGSITDALLLVQFALAGGCSICVSHLYGAKKFTQLTRLIKDMSRIIVLITVVLAAIGIVFSGQLINLIHTPKAIFEGAKTYYSVTMVGLPFMAIYNLEAGILSGMGDSKKPLSGIFISSCINVGLDLMCVVVFKLGITGAAIATVTAEGISAAYLFSKVRVKLKDIEEVTTDVPESMVGECVRLGIPQIIQSLVTSCGKILLQNITNILGAEVVIGVSLAFKVDSIVMIPLMSLATAVSVFAGQNRGAGREERVKASLRIGLIISAAMSVVITGVLYFLGVQMLGLFGVDAEVNAVGYRYLLLCMPFYWVFGAQFVCSGYLQGTKHTGWSSTIASTSLAVRVASCYIGAAIIGSDILAISEVLSWCVGLVLYATAIVHYNYRSKQ